MDYALIRNGTYINKVVFDSDESALAFKEAMSESGFIDDIVPAPDNFDIGDLYVEGKWSKQENITQEPTELEILGQEVASLKLSNIQKDMTINMLGQEMTSIKIKLIQGGM